MKFPLMVLIALMSLTQAHAQERTAAGALETQVTWSGLSTKIEAANAKADLIQTRVEQVVLCGKKGLIYAPEQTGADTEGCKVAAVDASVSNQITNIITCNANRQFFNGTACVAAVTPTPSCTLSARSVRTTGNTTCNAGETYVYQSSGPASSEKNYTQFLCMRVVCN